MTTQKIDDKLQQEIDRLERSGASARRLPVVIELASAVRAARDRDVGTVEEQVRAAQQPMLTRLAGMGIRDVEPLTLANAVAAELTPAQIREIASDPAVKRIIWNVAEHVAL